MNVIQSEIEGLVILEPVVFRDGRGCFLETFNKKSFDSALHAYSFCQDNESFSNYGVIRGLHYQKPPYAQTKLVRVSSGKILDVAVDLRTESQTFGRHLSVVLSSENKRQLLVPKGFAHGFAVLSANATVCYKVDEYYSPKHDGGLRWNDPDLNIDWNVSPNDCLVSEKDKMLALFADFESPF